jgi:hypothetical protein
LKNLWFFKGLNIVNKIHGQISSSDRIGWNALLMGDAKVMENEMILFREHQIFPELQPAIILSFCSIVKSSQRISC